MAKKYCIIVEHLDPELEDWQILEYRCIAEESQSQSWDFLLSGLESATQVQKLLDLPSTNLTEQSVEALYSTQDQRKRVCLLDPKAAQDLSPEDGEEFDIFLFGGILGDDPPRDRTSDLRKLGFSGRRLGSEQMTTDTAARVTRLIVQERQRLQDIPYIDRPELKVATGEGETSESVEMAFRYVKGKDGKPVMPKGMLELIGKDAEKDIMDLLPEDDG